MSECIYCNPADVEDNEVCPECEEEIAEVEEDKLWLEEHEIRI